MGQQFKKLTGMDFPQLAKDLLTHAELARMGLGYKELRRLVDHGELVRLRRGVYMDAARWAAEPKYNRPIWLARAHAMSAQNKQQPVYGLSTAARLHGLGLFETDQLIHVIGLSGPRSSGTAADVVPHQIGISPDQIRDIDGIRVSCMERTAVDCARYYSHLLGVVTMDSALNRGADPAEIERLIHDAGGRPGVRKARVSFELSDARTESAAETLTRLALRQMPCPPMIPQLTVVTTEGVVRLDFGNEEWRVGIEVDGIVKYKDFGPAEDVLIAERRRENLLTEQGWVLLRLRWKDLFDHAALQQRVLKTFARGQRAQRPQVAQPVPEAGPALWGSSSVRGWR